MCEKTVILRILTDSANLFSRGKVKSLLGFRAIREDVLKGVERYHLREEAAPYMNLFRPEKYYRDSENAYI
jgi:hypothetical protein